MEKKFNFPKMNSDDEHLAIDSNKMNIEDDKEMKNELLLTKA